jgi:hypothetical protein
MGWPPLYPTYTCDAQAPNEAYSYYIKFVCVCACKEKSGHASRPHATSFKPLHPAATDSQIFHVYDTLPGFSFPDKYSKMASMSGNLMCEDPLILSFLPSQGSDRTPLQAVSVKDFFILTHPFLLARKNYR